MAVLEALEVPVSSQVLVFSKTSLQTQLIDEATPRAIYFSDDTYVGYVPGGIVEVMVHDPKLGMAFYTLKRAVTTAQRTEFKRENSCLRCHAGHRTEGVPGAFIRSVSIGHRKEVRQPAFNVDFRTPYQQRWGGWYVTGEWGENFHMGNGPLKGTPSWQPHAQGNLGFLSDAYYPRQSSDVVALSILEHQVKVHNLITAAKMRFQRAKHLEEVVKTAPAGAALSLAERLSDELVEAMLFLGEAKMKPDGLNGSEEFQNDFKQAALKNSKGKSLRDLRLYGRLFKYRCSYMIYSSAFRSLPQPLQAMVLRKIKRVLTSEQPEAKFQYLSASERKMIHSILLETLREYGD